MLIANKIFIHFCNVCRIFCEGEWEKNISSGLFGLVSPGHNELIIAFSCNNLIELIMAFGHSELIELIIAISHSELIKLIMAFGCSELIELIMAFGPSKLIELIMAFIKVFGCNNLIKFSNIGPSNLIVKYSIMECYSKIYHGSSNMWQLQKLPMRQYLFAVLLLHVCSFMRKQFALL